MKKKNNNNTTQKAAAPIPSSIQTHQNEIISSEDGFDIKAALQASLANRGPKPPSIVNGDDNNNNNNDKENKENKDNKESKDNKENKDKKLKFVNPMSAAYNLYYRLVDPSRNVSIVPNEMVPDEIVEEIKKEDEIYKRQKAEYDYMQQFTTLNVYCQNQMKAINVSFGHLKTRQGFSLHRK